MEVLEVVLKRFCRSPEESLSLKDRLRLMVVVMWVDVSEVR
jgi:hypothetical protein